jgi:hypothetical protein
MKEKELDRQLKKIGKMVERKQIVKKAEEIARKYGEYKSETYPYRIKVHYNFRGCDYLGNEIVIEGSSGWSDFGGQDLSIVYVKQKIYANEVFKVSTSPEYDDAFTPAARPKENQVKMGELYLHQYHPGEWEAQLNRIYKTGPKKEKPKVVKPEEREIDKSKLEELADRLPIKI